MEGRQIDHEKGRARRRRAASKPNSLARRLRREIYKGLPAATWSLVQQVDPQWTSAETVAHFVARPDAGVDSRGAACAMQRACADNGLRAWCYEFGDPSRFTHMMVLVEEEPGHLLMHDPYLDLEGDGDVFDMLDRIGKGGAVALMGGSATRTYVADASLEDEVGRSWLGIAADAERGQRLQVRGGLGLLEATSPGYRTLRGSLGKAKLAALLAQPVALLSTLGEDGEHDLAERLGLNMEPAASDSATPEGPLMLAAHRRADQSNGVVQTQVAGILEQMSNDRSRLFEELMTLHSRTAQLSGELATAQVTVERAVATEKQAHDALKQLSERHEQMLASHRGEVSRLAEALSAAEAEARQSGQTAEHHRQEASRSAERLAQFKAELDDVRGEAEERQRELDDVRGEAEERQRELDELRAETRRLAEAVGAAEADARIKGDAAASYRADAARLAAQVHAAEDEHRRALNEAQAQTLHLATGLSVAEAEWRLKTEAAEALQRGVEGELRRQLAEALTTLDQTTASQRAVAGPEPDSMLASMTAGSAGVVLSGGGIGVRDHRGGCLCYGPYIHLAGGSYRLSIVMERPSLLGLLPSRAIVEIVDGPHCFSRQDVRLQLRRTEWALDFEVPPSVRPRAIEFRILVGRNSFATLRDLSLSSPA